MENYSECCMLNSADDSGFSSPGLCYEQNSSLCCENGSSAGRRGRPKAAMITSLMKEGAESNSGIRCEICSRVFPRDKSLQAHLRVHTGERPYSCDYPGCVRKFKQSGQLKTHQRLHTGERPFLCSAQGCRNRFTHANRHCGSHPGAALIRCDNFTPYNPDTAQSEEVRLWLIRYMNEKREPRSEKKPKISRGDRERRSSEETNGELCDMTNLQQRSEFTELTDMTNLQQRPDYIQLGVHASLDCTATPIRDSLRSPLTMSASRYEDIYWSESEDLTPAWSTPLPTCRPPVKSLFVDTPSPTLSPRKRELPKKRWLRIARREEESSANSRRPTVLRYLAASTPPHSGCRTTSGQLTPPYSSVPTCDDSLTPSRHYVSDSSPLLTRLLTMPQASLYEEDHTPLAVPLPHD